ncbi:hypothetical protein [Streptosporangium canum]
MTRHDSTAITDGMRHMGGMKYRHTGGMARHSGGYGRKTGLR